MRRRLETFLGSRRIPAEFHFPGNGRGVAKSGNQWETLDVEHVGKGEETLADGWMAWMLVNPGRIPSLLLGGPHSQPPRTLTLILNPNSGSLILIQSISRGPTLSTLSPITLKLIQQFRQEFLSLRSILSFLNFSLCSLPCWEG